MDLLEALALCGGAARRARLRELGVPERALAAGVRSGAVRRLGRGGYALLDASPGLAAAVRLGGVATHATAAALHGWPIWTPDEKVHVSVMSGTTRALAGVVVHQARLAPSDLERHRACTTPLRTALDCARTMPLVDAVCILDKAVRDCAVTECQLVEAAARSRGPGATALRRAVAHIDPRAASALESALRLLLRTTDARIRSQAYVRRVGDVDFLVDEWLVAEGDGFEFHSDRRAYRNDRQRGNGITANGLSLLRFTYEDVRFHPLRTIREIERVRQLRRPPTDR
ncbi:MAG: hypothetical protein ACT4QF_10620 [Sporichthyaceae bacterium]